MQDIEVRQTHVKPLNTSKIQFADKNKRVAFAIDRSGSMGSYMIGASDQDKYEWPSDLRSRIQAKSDQAVRRMMNKLSIEKFGIPLPYDPDLDETYPIEAQKEHDPFWASLAEMPIERAKAYLISAQKTEEIEASLQKHVSTRSGISKLEASKQFLIEYITQRFQVHGHADSLILAFDHEVSYSPAKGEEALLKAVESIHLGGGTDINAAVQTTLNVLSYMPPPRGNAGEQIVLITDAMDDEAGEMFSTFLPILLSRKIVLDFLHVVMPHESSEDGSAWEVIKQVCEASGGQYIRVETISAFREKFFEAANRLLIETGV